MFRCRKPERLFGVHGLKFGAKSYWTMVRNSSFLSISAVLNSVFSKRQSKFNVLRLRAQQHKKPVKAGSKWRPGQSVVFSGEYSNVIHPKKVGLERQPGFVQMLFLIVCPHLFSFCNCNYGLVVWCFFFTQNCPMLSSTKYEDVQKHKKIESVRKKTARVVIKNCNTEWKEPKQRIGKGVFFWFDTKIAESVGLISTKTVNVARDFVCWLFKMMKSLIPVSMLVRVGKPPNQSKLECLVALCRASLHSQLYRMLRLQGKDVHEHFFGGEKKFD